MVGGIITGVSRLTNGKFRLTVQGTGCEKHDERSILIINETSCRLMASVGDTVWWQGRKAYWTATNALTKENRHEDLALDRAF